MTFVDNLADESLGTPGTTRPWDVVLVDDSPDLRLLVRVAVEKDQRFRVVGEGDTGQDAIELAGRLHPDLLLLDVSMPVMDGLTALPQVLEASAPTKVVMFSGFDSLGLAPSALALGAAAYIDKSLPPSALPARLADALGAVGPAAPAGPPPQPDPHAQEVFDQHLERFRMAFDSAAIAMASLTLAGTIVRPNQAFCQLVGVPPEDLVGVSLIDLVEHGVRTTLDDDLARVAASHAVQTVLEHRVLHRDGTTPWVATTVAAVQDASGGPLYLFAQLADITERHLADEALRERERQLAEAQQLARLGSWEYIPATNAINWSDELYRIYGVDPEQFELTEASFFPLVHPDDRATTETEFKRAYAAGGSFTVDHRIVRGGSEVRWVQVQGRVIVDDDGTPIRMVGTTQDVTERRVVEEKFRGLLEALPDAIVIVQGDGTIALVNRQLEELFGYRREELVGAPVETLLPERLRAVHRSHRDDYFSAPRVRPMGAGLDLWGRRADGSELPVEISLSTLSTDEGVLVSAVIRDVTERKAFEAALRAPAWRHRGERPLAGPEAERPAGKELLDLLVDSAVDYAIFALDPEGRVTTWNKGAALLKGYHAEEIVGRHFSCFYPDTDVLDGKPGLLLEAARRDGRAHDEGWRVRKDGSMFWASVVITALRGDDGEVRGYGKVTRDLTDHKQLEDGLRVLLERERQATTQLQDLNRLKNEFVAIVAHDLRAPMAVVSGFIELLQESWPDLDDEQKRRYLGRMGDAMTRLQALVDDVLDVAHMDSGEMRFDIAPVDLGPLVEHVVAGLVPVAQEGRVRVRVGPGTVPALGDENRVWQVVSNLVSNALKFSPTTTPVEVDVYSTPSEVVVAVADEGPGVPGADVPRLFERFSRISPADGAQPGGTGLGLYIAKSIVEGLGGRIWVDTVPGEGFAVSFSLPRAGV